MIPAPVDKTWAALNDPETLKACIAGCQSLERTGDDAYTAVVAMKVGPVSARFKGNLKMTNVDVPNGYTIAFDGQGGVAGFGKGSADVSLVAEGDAATALSYDARASVGGKLAQIGSRLVDAAAAKVADDFFKAFEAHLRAEQVAGRRACRRQAVGGDAAAARARARACGHAPGGARLGAGGDRRGDRGAVDPALIAAIAHGHPQPRPAERRRVVGARRLVGRAARCARPNRAADRRRDLTGRTRRRRGDQRVARRRTQSM